MLDAAFDHSQGNAHSESAFDAIFFVSQDRFETPSALYGIEIHTALSF